MNENALTVSEAVMPALDVSEAVDRYNQMVSYVQKVMKPGIDYGTIPGTNNKAVLLKAGAEKLTTFFGLHPVFVDESITEDFSNPDRPVFFYRRKCQLWRDNVMVGEASGSCNSLESKYRYRTAKPTCPDCGAELRRSKNKDEWYCWAKTGGCGATFPIKDKRIAKQETGRVENPDIADLANTILKMADKRALIAATLIAANASEFFTQDLEDLPIIAGEVVSDIQDAEFSPPIGRTPPELAEGLSEDNYANLQSEAEDALSGEFYWIDDPPKRVRFWQWAREEKALEAEDIHQAIRTTSVHDFCARGGSMADIKAIIEAYVTAVLAEQEWPTPEALEMWGHLIG